MAPFSQKGGKQYAFHFYRNRRKSSRLPWDPRWEATGRKLHVRWIEDQILRDRGLIGTDETPAPTLITGRPTSFLQLADAFRDAHGHTLSRNAKAKIRQALKAYFGDADVILTFDAIHDRIVERLGALNYEPGTIRKHLVELRRICRHGVNRDWLPRNPVDVIGIPDEPRKNEVNVWTREQIATMCRHSREKSSYIYARELALFLEWQSLVSMRPSESLRMLWRHVEPGRLYIPQTKTDYPRSLPLVESATIDHPARAAWQARLREILTEQRGWYETNRPHVQSVGHRRGTWREGYVWPWKTTEDVNKEFKKIRDIPDLKLPAYRLYDLRASAEDHWVWDLGFGMETICELAGHSPAVYMKHYRRRYGAEDLARMIRE